DVPADVAPPEPADVVQPPARGDAPLPGALKAPVIVEPDPPEAPPLSLRSVEIAPASVEGRAATLDLALTPRKLAVGECLPGTARQLGQSWRRLRRMEARGPRTELDLPATVADIERTGVWGRPALTARRLNVAQLLLLVDRDGSMTPFVPLTRRIVDSA